MAENFRRATTAIPRTYILGQHDDHAKRLGRLVALWASIEYLICFLMGQVLESPPWKAQAAYYAIANLNTRLDILRDVAPHVGEPEKYKDRLLEIISRTRDLAKKRNGYVHKPWVLHKGHPYILESLWNYPTGEKRKVHVKEIQDLINETIDLLNSIGEFAQDYSHDHGVILRGNRIPEKFWRKYQAQSLDPNASSDPKASESKAKPRRGQ